jgi:hypothetical protein
MSVGPEYRTRLAETLATYPPGPPPPPLHARQPFMATSFGTSQSTLYIHRNMDSLNDSLAFWATILGTVLGISGFIQSYTWLTVVGTFVLFAAIVSFLYAERQRRRIRSARVSIEGRSIDSLNVASLNRRLDQRLVMQEVHQTATIDGENLAIAWECAGYCRSNQATVVEFSVDSDNNIPFEDLACLAYDLRNDSQRRHVIRPILVAADGISKKLAVPLLVPLKQREPFRVFLSCELPGCMKAGVEYFTATLSFEQNTVPQCTIRLRFLRCRPDWVRVYECLASGTTRLLQDLPPVREDHDATEYLDIVHDASSKCARVYVFRRIKADAGRSAAGNSLVK